MAKEEKKSDVDDVSDEEILPLSDTVATTSVMKPADDQMTDWVELVEAADCADAKGG